MKIYSSVVSGSLKVHGDITAETYITRTNLTEFTQSFSSGSTKFGDSPDDTHQFTGSLFISGSRIGLHSPGNYGTFLGYNVGTGSGYDELYQLRAGNGDNVDPYELHDVLLSLRAGAATAGQDMLTYILATADQSDNVNRIAVLEIFYI